MAHYDPVVFDLDGTVLDSAPAITKALEEACVGLGLTRPGQVDFSSCVGPPLDVALPRVLGSGVDSDSVIRAYRKIYRPLAERETKPMQGVVELASALKENGIRLGIATYKPRNLALSLLTATGIAPLFDECEGRLHPTDNRTKTEILDSVLKRLTPHGGTPLYIGDHDEDRVAADALSVEFVPYGGDVTWAHISRELLEVVRER